jgi:hypothetical protein
MTAAALVVVISSPAMGGEYIVGTKKNPELLGVAPEKTEKKTEPSNWPFSEQVFFYRESEEARAMREARRKLFASYGLEWDDFSGSQDIPARPPLSSESLRFLGEVLNNMVSELRAMKENAWLAEYPTMDEALPLGGKVTTITRCEIAAARAELKELGQEIPGSEITPDWDFSRLHIEYYTEDVPEHIVPARWCESYDLLSGDGNCVRHFNRLHYTAIIRLAEEWKSRHPDKQECFVYLDSVPAKAATPTPSGEEFIRDTRKKNKPGQKTESWQLKR